MTIVVEFRAGPVINRRTFRKLIHVNSRDSSRILPCIFVMGIEVSLGLQGLIVGIASEHFMLFSFLEVLVTIWVVRQVIVPAIGHAIDV